MSELKAADLESEAVEIPRYVYYVAYAYPLGFGAMDVGTPHRVASSADVQEFIGVIAKTTRTPASSIIVLNWILLSGPKEA